MNYDLYVKSCSFVYAYFLSWGHFGLWLVFVYFLQLLYFCS